MALPKSAPTPVSIPDRDATVNSLVQTAGAQGINVQQTDPRLEYVSGGFSVPTWMWLAQLPTPDDDLDNLIGNDVYGRMAADEQIFSSTMTLVMMTLRRKLTLRPAYADPERDPDDFDNGIQVRDFCRRALDNLGKRHTTIDDVLAQMLWAAMRFGNNMAEITYERGTGEDANRYYFAKIKPKSRHNTFFVVDVFFNFLGFAVYTGPYEQWLAELTRLVESTDGKNTLVTTETLLNAPAKQIVDPGAGKPKMATTPPIMPIPAIWNFVSREKFAVLTLLDEFADPRGRSWWRSIYNQWYLKMHRLEQANLYGRRFGLPIPIGIASPTAPDQYPFNPDGTVNTSAPKITASQALLQVLQFMQAGNAVAAPAGTIITLSQNVNDGGYLAGSIEQHDAAIIKGITFQKLATSASPHQAKAAGTVHENVLNTPVHYLKEKICRMVKYDILAPLVELNFGPEFRKYIPEPDLGKIDNDDLVPLLVGIGQFMANGGGHYSMLPELQNYLGLPECDIRQWMEDIKAEKALLVATGTPDPAGDGSQPGGAGGGLDQDVKNRIGRNAGERVSKKVMGRDGAGFSRQTEAVPVNEVEA